MVREDAMGQRRLGEYEQFDGAWPSHAASQEHSNLHTQSRPNLPIGAACAA